MFLEFLSIDLILLFNFRESVDRPRQGTRVTPGRDSQQGRPPWNLSILLCTPFAEGPDAGLNMEEDWNA